MARLLFNRGYLWLIVLFSVFCYPLSLFPPALQIGKETYFNLPYSFSIPASIILGILAIFVIVFNRWKLPHYLVAVLATFLTMLIISVPIELEYLDDFFFNVGYVTIPLAAAILYRNKYLSLPSLAKWSVILWVLQIVTGAITLFRHGQPVGTPGNVNWMAAYLLMLSPFVFSVFKEKTQRWLKNRQAAFFVALCLWFIPTIFLLYHCQSRAAWLAIAFLPCFLVLIKLQRIVYKTLWIILLLLGAIGSVTAVYTWYPNQLLRVVEKDVRLPLWTGTAVMVVKNPLGVGSGMYQEHFTPLRRVSSYQDRLYAADMTNHPHNELLNIGAQLGIPALLAFLIMLFQIGRSAEAPLTVCIRISGYFVVMTAMFDMTLVQPPTSFLGLFILGLNWPLQPPATQTGVTELKWLPLRAVVSALAVTVVAIYSFFDLRHDYYYRNGLISEEKAETYARSGMVEKSHAQYRQAINQYRQSVVFFSRLKPHYKMGYLYLKLGGEVEQVEKHLKLVTSIDPRFSHIHMLLAQMNLQKRDLVAAEKYLQQECALYPRNEKAWQTMYSFSAGVGSYNRVLAIDSHLKNIYQERARQNFGGALAQKTAQLRASAFSGKLLEGVEQANALLGRINSNFTDPIFLELSVRKRWPLTLKSRDFTPLDIQTWHLRTNLFKQLRDEFDTLPVDPDRILSWFIQAISIDEEVSSTFPLNVWQKKRGNLTAAYLLLSMVFEINQTPSILHLDNNQGVMKMTLFSNTDGTQYEANLAKGTIIPLPVNVKSTSFKWVPGKTVIFVPFSDYFLRNQILANLNNEFAYFFPTAPPMNRILNIFALTDQPAPPVPVLKRFFFTHNIEEIHKQLQR